MKKKDLALISETYAKSVLNENVPPFELGGSYENPDPSKYETGERGKFKAFQSEKYPKQTRGFSENPDYERLLTAIISRVGKEIVAAITDAEGRIEDTKQEAGQRAGEIINRTILVKGQPLFQASHAQHLGRNIIDALERAGVIKELPRTRSGGESSVASKAVDITDFDEEV